MNVFFGFSSCLEKEVKPNISLPIWIRYTSLSLFQVICLTHFIQLILFLTDQCIHLVCPFLCIVIQHIDYSYFKVFVLQI